MAASYPITYTSVSDVLNILPNIGSVTNITSADIAYQIGKTEVYINQKLAEYYTVPVSPVPYALTAIATEYTIYEISKRLTMFKKGQDNPFDAFKSSIELLDEIASGKVPLLDSSYQIIAKKTSSSFVPYSNTSSFLPTFTEDDFENQLLDEDKIE